MSVSNLVAQVAPMSHVAKVALQEQEVSGIKQAAMQHVVQENLKKDGEKVEKTAPDEAGHKVRRKDEREKDQPERQGGERPPRSAARPDGETDGPAENAGAPAGDVWSGNIVNVRI